MATRTTSRARKPTKTTVVRKAPGSTAGPAFLHKLNAELPPKSRVAYEGAAPFGARAIEQFRLGNGLRVLVLVDDSAPVVSYHTWYRVGSRHEVEGKTGLAHLFEHLMFNETKNLPAGTFDKKLERAGAQTNAATWNDWTYYHEDVPRSQLPLVVSLEAERMKNLVLREPQLKSEKEVVANERRFRVDDDVEGAVNELLYQTAFEKHPYHHPTIGWMDDILNFTTQDCRGFYKTYYAPNNATVVVVGDVTVAKALALVVKAYAKIPASAIPAEVRVDEPEQFEERVKTIEKPTPTGKFAIGYRGPALADDDHAPLSVLSEALFGGRSARIYRSLVTSGEHATDLGASVSSFHDPGLFEISATAREGVSAARLLELLDADLASVARDGVNQDERDRAVARIELGFLQGLETASGRAEQIGFFDTVLNEPAGGFSRLEAIRAVTPARMREVAEKYLDRRRRTVILVNPAPADAVSAGAGEAQVSA